MNFESGDTYTVITGNDHTTDMLRFMLNKMMLVFMFTTNGLPTRANRLDHE
jgi:hypothetical protein